MNGLQFELNDLRVRGAACALLSGVQCSVQDGDVLFVTGPSGAGKSSLLSWLAGCLDSVFMASGRIWLDGQDLQDVPLAQRRMGWVFQDPLLFPHLSVAGNLSLSLRTQPRAERAGRISQALDSAGLAGLQDRDPASLSGGQKARVALLRSLLASPRVLLLDEPFASLDGARRSQLRQWLFAEMRRLGMVGVLVSHQDEDAPDDAQRLVVRLHD